MSAGISIRYATTVCALLFSISASIVAAQSTQKSIMDEVKRFIGPGAKGGWTQKVAGLDCAVYRSSSGTAYVDRHSHKVVQVHFTGTPPSRQDIGMAAARRRAMDWLEQHGIALQGWKSDGEYRLDHGAAGIEYNFGWGKRAPNGAQLPSLMTAIVAGAGELVMWYRIDRKPQVSMTPDISAKQAMDIMTHKLKMNLSLEPNPQLRAWLRKGKQRLYWDIRFHAFGDPKCTGGGEVDAHTGELLDLYPPQRPKGLPGARPKR